MAEKDRTNADVKPNGQPGRRSEDLSAILQRIANHIAEVERRQGGAGEAGSPVQASPGAPAPAPASGAPGASARTAAANEAAAAASTAGVPASSPPAPANGAVTQPRASLRRVSHATSEAAPSIAMRATEGAAAAAATRPEAALPGIAATPAPAASAGAGESPARPSQGPLPLMQQPSRIAEEDLPPEFRNPVAPAPAAATRPAAAHPREDLDSLLDRSLAREPEDADEGHGVIDTPLPSARRTQPGAEPPALRSALAGKAAASAAPAVSAPPAAASTLRLGKRLPAAQPQPTTAPAPAEPAVVEPLAPSAADPAPATTAAQPAAAEPAAAEPASATEPWDSQSAEALTRLYEQAGEGVPPLRSMLELMGGAPASQAVDIEPMAPESAAPAPHLTLVPQAPVPAMPVVRRPAAPVEVRSPVAESTPPAAALPPEAGASEARELLADLSGRIEAALKSLAPMSAVEGLGTRFSAIEARIGEALAGLAVRADAGGGEIVATHMAELQGQMTRAEERLQRIEPRLDELALRLSDDRVVELFGSLVPTSEDLARFAEEAAGRSADRALEGFLERHGEALAARPAASAASAGPELGMLAELLANFMDERRRNDAGTLDALETLQLAMQHMLDRIDLIEAGRTQAPAPAPAPVGDLGAVSPRAEAAATPPALPAQRQASPGVAHAPIPAQVADADGDDDLIERLPPGLAARARASVPPEPQAGPRPANPASARAPAGPAPMSSAPTPQAPARSARSEPAAPPAPAPAATPARAGGATGGSATPAPSAADARAIPDPADRKAFIELARKAAERAKAEAGQGSPAPDKDAKAQPALRTQVFTTAKEEPQPASRVRPAVLGVAAVATLALAGYWFLAGPRPGRTAGDPVAIERKAPAVTSPAVRPAPVPAAGSAPDIDTEERSPSRPARPRAGLSDGHDQAAAVPARADEEDDGPRLSDAHIQGGPVAPGPDGITLAGVDRRPSAAAVLRSRDRIQLAQLSEQAARNAARLHPARGVSIDGAPVAAPAMTTASAAPALPPALPVPMPAASRAPAPASDRADRAIVTGSVSPPEPVGATQPAAPAGASVPGHATQAEGPRRLELPPAPIGPLSLRLAAAKGDPAAQLEIAARYAEGKGVKQSFADAADWYVRAADQGLAVAQYRLAALYERGMGVKADAARARIWYERAARAGNIKAMHNLAVLSASHAAGQPDYAMAARWFAEAAERGLADSQFNLAILTESGQGVAKDLTRALTWYMLAARSGDREAARRRDQLIARLPEEAVQAADKAASEWRAKPADQRANDAKAAGDGWRRRVVGKGSA